MICLFVGGTAVTGSAYGKPNAPILVSNTDCIGSERTLRNCQYTQLTEDESATLYAKASVAGVKCSSPVTTTQPSTTRTPTAQPSSAHKISPTSIALAVMTVLLVLLLILNVR